MKRLLKLALPILCVLALVSCKPAADKPAASASASVAAKNSLQPSFAGDYATLSIPQATSSGAKVEVLEFFGYFCSHCRSFEPLLTSWAKKNKDKIVFKRVPVGGTSPAAMAQQRMYYALEAMGVLESIHPDIFRAYQDERVPLGSDEEVLAYIVKKGIDQAQFLKHYNSPEVRDQVAKAHAQTEAYLIEGVPTLAIDGRYITSATHASKRPDVEKTESGVHKGALAIADDLIAKTLKERQAKK